MFCRGQPKRRPNRAADRKSSAQRGRALNGSGLWNRMDGIHVESHNRLLEAESRMQVLLRGTPSSQTQSHGPAELQEWVSIDAAAAHAGGSARLEKAANHIRQFDERPVSP